MIALKKIFLLVLLSLTGLAVIITLCVMFTETGYRGTDIALGSAMSVGFLLLLSFGAFTAFDKRGIRWIAFIGCGMCAVLIVVFPLYLWWESTTRAVGAPRDYDTDRFVSRCMATAFMTAALFCLVPFVLSAKNRTMIRILQLATVAFLLMTFACMLLLVWSDNHGDDFGKLLIAGFILSGAGILSIFILNRFFGIKVADALSTVGQVIAIRCPRCNKEQELAIGDSACAFCRLRIKIEVEEPKCATCGYNLHQLTRPICPECGTPVMHVQPPADPTAELQAWAQANDAQKR